MPPSTTLGSWETKASPAWRVGSTTTVSASRIQQVLTSYATSVGRRRPSVTPRAPNLTTGATAYGSHYLSTYDRCERLGFLSFLAPHPKGGQGLRLQYPPRPLKLGGILHEGWAAYYRSGPRDPEARDIDYAVATLEAAAAARSGEWQTPEMAAEDVAKGRAILYDYHPFLKGDRKS